MLINIAAPRPKDEGMDMNAVDVTPGSPPPWLIPHCRQCREAVDKFTIDYIASPFYLPIQFTCHGKTSGIRVPSSEAIYKSKHGGLIWVF